jgi:polyisoprenoid-binding protein YceI
MSTDLVTGVWKADPAHSEIAFSMRQLGVAVRGRFTDFDVTIVTADEPLASSVTATIDLTSLTTGNRLRDKHLRLADYHGAKRNPTMSYRSTGIRHTDDGWLVDGELTLHGVTRQVPLTVEEPGLSDRRARFCATARLNRRDFGIRITGGVVIANEVSIDLEIEAGLQRGNR